MTEMKWVDWTFLLDLFTHIEEFMRVVHTRY
jgi:hypothetical protein